ncbi:glycosyltransferase family 2 protein [Rhizobacter sp. P5_C2]
MAAATYAIFLPVRNGGEHIRLAIDSVCAQTFADWRLVILENGSTDDTLAQARAHDDPRISVVPAEQALGIVGNWQRVAELLRSGHVTAEFATLIGHDDLLYPDFLATIERLRTEQPTAGLYQTGFDLIDQHGQLIRPCKPVPVLETAADFLSSRGWGLRDSFGTGYVFRVSDYLRVGGIPDLPLLMFSDDLLFARLGQQGGKACAEEVACAYRLHRGSTSASLSAGRLSALAEALQRFLGHVENDFPAYWTSSRGKAAVACLIAREALIFRSPLLRWALSPAANQAVAALHHEYGRCANGVVPGQWLGTNFVTREVYTAVRTVFLLLSLLLERVRRK